PGGPSPFEAGVRMADGIACNLLRRRLARGAARVVAVCHAVLDELGPFGALLVLRVRAEPAGRHFVLARHRKRWGAHDHGGECCSGNGVTKHDDDSSEPGRMLSTNLGVIASEGRPSRAIRDSASASLASRATTSHCIFTPI